jgi:hypothetical protein
MVGKKLQTQTYIIFPSSNIQDSFWGLWDSYYRHKRVQLPTTPLPAPISAEV